MTDPELWERQRRSFEQTAQAYARYRPAYAGGAFEDLRAYASLEPDDRILEIGCGAGQATRSVAGWGRVLAIDPSDAMVAIARRSLAGSTDVEFRVARFEDVEESGFGMLLSAQAFHWLDQATKYERCARALRSGGALALLWNTQVVPPDNRLFFERVQTVYAEHARALAHKGDFRTDAADDTQLHEMLNSGYFEDGRVFRHHWHWTLPRDTYIGLMSTHSPHAALPDDDRRRLHAGIAALIDAEFGGEVTEHYVTELFVGRRR